ncbi:hypothetical protein ACFXON_24675, partial [Bacillus subtilis]
MHEGETGQGSARARFAAELSALRRRSNISAQDVSAWVKANKHTSVSTSTLGDWFKAEPSVPRDNTKFLMAVECLYRAASENWTRAAESHWKQLRAKAFEESPPAAREQHTAVVEDGLDSTPAQEGVPTPAPSPPGPSRRGFAPGRIGPWTTAGIAAGCLVLVVGAGFGVHTLISPSSAAKPATLTTGSPGSAPRSGVPNAAGQQSALTVSTETVIRGHCSTIVFPGTAAQLGAPPADPHDETV